MIISIKVCFSSASQSNIQNCITLNLISIWTGDSVIGKQQFLYRCELLVFPNQNNVQRELRHSFIYIFYPTEERLSYRDFVYPTEDRLSDQNPTYPTTKFLSD